MSDLAHRFTAMGLEDVSTFIASGNVLFTADSEPDRLARMIEADLLAWLGAPVAVMVRTWDDLQALVAANPFKGIRRNRDAKLYVAFLWEAPKESPRLPRRHAEQGLTLARILGREVFVVAERLPSGRHGFPNLPVERELGLPATSRSWNTILRLAKLPVPEIR
jgi:uncharacterized protein (DUF1697 family)